MTVRKPFVGGNWKMNTTAATAAQLAVDVACGCDDLLGRADVAVFPPFPYLDTVGKHLGNGVRLGAQDLYHEAEGAFTGEVSAGMLIDVGVGVVLVGHSERRHVIGEGDELINCKARAALGAGLDIILCIGETIEQREAGQTQQVNVGQLMAGLEAVAADQMPRVTIAYEPVWAIGTGRTATPDDAQAVHAVIRSTLADRYDGAVAESTRIQYGGSVKANNAQSLFAEPDIDGGLIGGASLKADDFVTIVTAAAQASS
jgi:triosephosphate isomerase